MIRKPFFIALLIAVAVGLLTAAVLPIKALLYHSPDDAFFYLKTAWNFAAGQGSTFDGFNPTNGYHPLWFLALSAMFFAGELLGIASPDTMYRISFALQWLLLIGTVYYSARALRIIASGRDLTARMLLLGILVYGLVFVRVVGSEAQISVFIVALYVFVKSLEWESGIPRYLLKSALLALLFLARIDYVSTLVPALWFADTLSSPRGYRLKSAFFLSAMVGATAVTYFFINYMEFGHLLTVSASWKSEFPRFLLLENIPMYLRSNPVQFARAVAAIAVCLWFALRVYRRRASAAPLDAFLAWTAVGAALFMLQTMSFNAHKIREWYTSVPVFIAILIAVRHTLDWEHFPGKRITTLVTAPLAAMGLAFLLFAGMIASKWDANYDFAHALEERIGTEDPVMIVDCAGIVGYFSRVPIVNGDGLVNSFEYLEYVRRGELREWLAVRRVPYYATYSAVQPDSLDGAFLDVPVSGLGGMDFVFDSSQAVMRAPFSIDNIRFHSRGEWVVFRIANPLDEGARHGE